MTLDPAAIRKDFPHLDRRLYLNTASTGVAWRGAGYAAARFYDDMYARGYDGRDDWRAVAGRVRDQVGRLANVDPEHVGFAGSTTEALNLIAHSVPVRQGDRIVYLADEFPSVCEAAGILAARGGVRIALPIGDETRRTAILAEAAAGSGYVLASHVHWETGAKLDLVALSRACRAAGALLIVDGIQALGATEIDASLTDAYVASVFKWLISGFGLAIVITSPALRDLLVPVFRGYANPAPSRALGYSHANYPGLVTLEASLAYLEGLGWPAIFSRNRDLVARLREYLSGADIATPPEAASLLSLRVPDPAAAAAALDALGVSIEARGAGLRVSPHFYNDEADIDRFAELFLQATKGK